jgi:hypothetical protein
MTILCIAVDMRRNLGAISTGKLPLKSFFFFFWGVYVIVYKLFINNYIYHV